MVSTRRVVCAQTMAGVRTRGRCPYSSCGAAPACQPAVACGRAHASAARRLTGTALQRATPCGLDWQGVRQDAKIYVCGVGVLKTWTCMTSRVG
jgi:hypothetical protein